MKKVTDPQEPTGPNQGQPGPKEMKPESTSSEFFFVIIVAVIGGIILAAKALGLY
jgi:hypothetical protein